MSYLRANGRLTGRASGRWGRASVAAGYQLGDTADMGTSVAVNGDPVLALIAQLNRFAGKSLKPGGCSERVFVRNPLPMTSSLSDAAATAATIIVFTRYSCVPDEMISTRAKWAADGLAGDTRAFVLANINEIVTTIAQFGDKLGLAPASYGITTRDPKFAPKISTTQVLMLGGIGLAAVLLLRRM